MSKLFKNLSVITTAALVVTLVSTLEAARPDGLKKDIVDQHELIDEQRADDKSQDSSLTPEETSSENLVETQHDSIKNYREASTAEDEDDMSKRQEYKASSDKSAAQDQKTAAEEADTVGSGDTTSTDKTTKESSIGSKIDQTK